MSALSRRVLRRGHRTATGLPCWRPGTEASRPRGSSTFPTGTRRPLQVTHRLPDIAGAVETVAWSPDGSRLCLVVAQFGAEVSDVYGSGTVSGPAAAESWRPVVSPADDSGRRMLHVWDLATGTVEVICPAANVWEAGWYGPDRLIALVTDAAGEGAWYGATVQAVGIDGRAEQLHRSDVQMAQPRANPSGDRWSVLSARASDRGLLAGDLIVGSEHFPGTPVRHGRRRCDRALLAGRSADRVRRTTRAGHGVRGPRRGGRDSRRAVQHRWSEWEVSAGGRRRTAAAEHS